MTKTQITLTNKQFSESVSSLVEGKKNIKTIHPADNMLFLTLENQVSINITGHWEYISGEEKIISSILENESVEDNFNKIEDLAEKLSAEKPVIKKISLQSDASVKISFTNKSTIIISIYKVDQEQEFLSFDYSSQDDTTHFHYTYENGNWQQSILFKQ